MGLVTHLQMALSYAARGWPVLPLHSPGEENRCTCGNGQCSSPAKHPRTVHGLKDATTDRETITSWWTKWPEANIGILTGRESGLAVLDVDPRNGGLESFAMLEDYYGRFPSTLKVLSGGGGFHLYFRYPNEGIRSRANLYPGLDLKADSGYVVAPPSIHVSGKPYVFASDFEEATLTELPLGVLRIALTKEPSKQMQAGQKIPRGERNNRLTSLAGAMRRQGASKETISRALASENKYCDPPLPADETHRIAKNIVKYKPHLGDEKPKQADRLIALAEDFVLFHTEAGEPFATVPVLGHKENWPLKSKHIRNLLAARFHEKEGTAPGSQAIQDALTVLAGKALYEGSQEKVFTRLAGLDGNTYLDLGDSDWTVIVISPQGWEVLSDSALIKFRRPSGLLPLPLPQRGGHLEELRGYLNTRDEQTWQLLLSWLIAALRPTGPYPILFIHGEQGSAKSTTAKVLRALVDPCKAPLRPQPTNVRDLMIAANNNWVLALDNISNFSPWFPDALCRLSTGGGYATRELYSDDGEVIFEAQRPVIITGIEELATRPDLLDRAMVLYLPRISDRSRKVEEYLWAGFENSLPRILGSLLDALSQAIRQLPSIPTTELPRMADFARLGMAAETPLGFSSGTFLEAYKQNRETQIDAALEASPLADLVLRILCKEASWKGTASELLEALEDNLGDLPKNDRTFPKNPSVLSNSLRRLAPVLRARGVRVDFHPRKAKRREISLELTASGPSSSSSIVSPEASCGSFWGLDLRTHRDGNDSNDGRQPGDSRSTSKRSGLAQQPSDWETE